MLALLPLLLPLSWQLAGIGRPAAARTPRLPPALMAGGDKDFDLIIIGWWVASPKIPPKSHRRPPHHPHHHARASRTAVEVAPRPPCAATTRLIRVCAGVCPRSGVGGHGAALHAVSRGLKVAVCAGEDVGGTCVNRGCVPSKALLAASGRVREMSDEKHLADLGVTGASYVMLCYVM